MTQDEDWNPPWLTDVKVFVVTTLLNVALLCAGWVILWTVDMPKRYIGPGCTSDVWFWVFASPASMAQASGRGEWVQLLILLNPLIYGLLGWALWRWVRLFWNKPVG